MAKIYALVKLNRKFEIWEERISSLKIKQNKLQSKEQVERRLNKKSLKICGKHYKCYKHKTEPQKKGEKGEEKYMKKQSFKFPNIMKNSNLQI